jgi:hypothetical protein
MGGSWWEYEYDKLIMFYLQRIEFPRIINCLIIKKNSRKKIWTFALIVHVYFSNTSNTKPNHVSSSFKYNLFPWKHCNKVGTSLCICKKCESLTYFTDFAPTCLSQPSRTRLSYYTCVTNGAGTLYLAGAHEFTPVFSSVHVAQSLIFCIVFCRSLPFYFVLRFNGSDYPFGIFNLF